MKKYLKTTEGFSLVETLVAIGILTTVITGAYAAAQSGITTSSSSKNQVIAFYLAQEGMEQIRNTRDENGFDPDRDWLQGISAGAGDPCYFGKVCMTDVLTGTLSECPGGSGNCPILKQDPTTGLYGYTASWPNTIFRRQISLSRINADEVTVEVTVTWTRGALTNQFRATENILNWQ